MEDICLTQPMKQKFVLPLLFLANIALCIELPHGETLSENVTSIENSEACPKLYKGLPNIEVAVGDVVYFDIPDDAFTGNFSVLQLTVNGDERFPKWLFYNSTEETFDGSPQAEDVGTLKIDVIVGCERCRNSCANVSSTFNIIVRSEDAAGIERSDIDENCLLQLKCVSTAAWAHVMVFPHLFSSSNILSNGCGMHETTTNMAVLLIPHNRMEWKDKARLLLSYAKEFDVECSKLTIIPPFVLPYLYKYHGFIKLDGGTENVSLNDVNYLKDSFIVMWTIACDVVLSMHSVISIKKAITNFILKSEYAVIVQWYLLTKRPPKSVVRLRRQALPTDKIPSNNTPSTDASVQDNTNITEQPLPSFSVQKSTLSVGHKTDAITQTPVSIVKLTSDGHNLMSSEFVSIQGTETVQYVQESYIFESQVLPNIRISSSVHVSHNASDSSESLSGGIISNSAPVSHAHDGKSVKIHRTKSYIPSSLYHDIEGLEDGRTTRTTSSDLALESRVFHGAVSSKVDIDSNGFFNPSFSAMLVNPSIMEDGVLFIQPSSTTSWQELLSASQSVLHLPALDSVSDVPISAVNRKAKIITAEGLREKSTRLVTKAIDLTSTVAGLFSSSPVEAETPFSSAFHVQHSEDSSSYLVGDISPTVQTESLRSTIRADSGLPRTHSSLQSASANEMVPLVQSSPHATVIDHSSIVVNREHQTVISVSHRETRETSSSAAVDSLHPSFTSALDADFLSTSSPTSSLIKDFIFVRVTDEVSRPGHLSVSPTTLFMDSRYSSLDVNLHSSFETMGVTPSLPTPVLVALQSVGTLASQRADQSGVNIPHTTHISDPLSSRVTPDTGSVRFVNVLSGTPDLTIGTPHFSFVSTELATLPGDSSSDSIFTNIQRNSIKGSEALSNTGVPYLSESSSLYYSLLISNYHLSLASIPNSSITSTLQASSTGIPNFSHSGILHLSIQPSSASSLPYSSISNHSDSGISSLQDSSMISIPHSSVTSILKSSTSAIPDSLITSIPDSSVASILDASITHIKHPFVTSIPDWYITSIPNWSITSISVPSVENILHLSTTNIQYFSVTSMTDSSITFIPESFILSVPDSSITSIPDLSITFTPESSISVPDSLIASIPHSSITSIIDPSITSILDSSITNIPYSSAADSSIISIVHSSIPYSSVNKILPNSPIIIPSILYSSLTSILDSSFTSIPYSSVSNFLDLSTAGISDPSSVNYLDSHIRSIADLSITRIPYSSISSIPCSSISSIPCSSISRIPDPSITSIPDLSITSIPDLSITSIPDPQITSVNTLTVPTFLMEGTHSLMPHVTELNSFVDSSLETFDSFAVPISTWPESLSTSSYVQTHLSSKSSEYSHLAKPGISTPVVETPVSFTSPVHQQSKEVSDIISKYLDVMPSYTVTTPVQDSHSFLKTDAYSVVIDEISTSMETVVSNMQTLAPSAVETTAINGDITVLSNNVETLLETGAVSIVTDATPDNMKTDRVSATLKATSTNMETVLGTILEASPTILNVKGVSADVEAAPSGLDSYTLPAAKGTTQTFTYSDEVSIALKTNLVSLSVEDISVGLTTTPSSIESQTVSTGVGLSPITLLSEVPAANSGEVVFLTTYTETYEGTSAQEVTEVIPSDLQPSSVLETVIVHSTREKQSISASTVMSSLPVSVMVPAVETPPLLSTTNPPTTTYVSERPNRAPILVKPLGRLLVGLGQHFQLTVPSGTFMDAEDGDSRNLTLSLYRPSRVDLSPDFWLQFNAASQTIYGIPLAKDFRAHPIELVLSATDSGGLVAMDTIIVSLDAGPLKDFSHDFVLTLDMDYSVFMASPNNLIMLLEKIQKYFGDKSSDSVSVLSVNKGSVIVSWANNTLSKRNCEKLKIHQVYSKISDSDGEVNSMFFSSMLPEFYVSKVGFRLRGICAPSMVYPPPATSPKTEIRKTHGMEWYEVVLPALVVIFAILLILFVGVICCRRLRHRGKSVLRSEKDDFAEFGQPVMLPEEMELDDINGKPCRPLVLATDPEENPLEDSSVEARPPPPEYHPPDGKRLSQPLDYHTPVEPGYDNGAYQPPPMYRIPPTYSSPGQSVA